jgi:hypothetical protein
MFTVNVSAGELLDKYSILEIKLERIGEGAKKKCVKEEMDELDQQVLPVLREHPLQLEYKLLKHVNETIWDLNDMYCNMSTFNGKVIMEENNARFRIKRWINNKLNSHLQEVKSYGKTRVWVNAIGEPGTHPLNILLFAQWKMLYHDEVYIVISGETTDDDMGVYREQIRAHGDEGRIFVVRDHAELHEILVDADMTLVPSEFINIMLDH